jgi:DNA modification methylase
VHRVPGSPGETGFKVLADTDHLRGMTANRPKQPDAIRPSFSTDLGVSLHGTLEQLLATREAERYARKVQLIFTSPPFPLNRKKRYGNLQGEEYLEWLAGFAPALRELLRPAGSIVLELGNAWEPGLPVMSTLALRALLRFQEAGRLHLCQQFVCYNPARLPSPVEWVNVKRIRVKDSFTHLWWMSGTAFPNASNRRILKPYSEAMHKLLAKQAYNSGKRPSQHDIGRTSFLRNNRGAIPSNVLTVANTRTNDAYQQYCREHHLRPHPARMPQEVAEFFVRFLTRKGDLVLDPFAGSNTTGAAAEQLGRRWLSVELNRDYIETSKGRFPSVSAGGSM